MDSQRSSGSETLPKMKPRNTPTLNGNSEFFQPKQTIPSCVESLKPQRGEFVGHSKGHSTMLLSTTLVYCQSSRVEVFPLRALLDSGSQSNLIIHEASLALGLRCERRDLLRIVKIDSPVKIFTLTTVTYGTKSAPHLATSSLKQLAIDDSDKYPLAAEVLMCDVYMDDLTGQTI
ncbi:hypothetical protein TNCV_4286931 [Trichonephila clavipes]|nr:hypothetical protein TNCV_4286931 [Trichonephila clavipes]